MVCWIFTKYLFTVKKRSSTLLFNNWVKDALPQHIDSFCRIINYGHADDDLHNLLANGVATQTRNDNIAGNGLATQKIDDRNIQEILILILEATVGIVSSINRVLLYSK